MPRAASVLMGDERSTFTRTPLFPYAVTARTLRHERACKLDDCRFQRRLRDRHHSVVRDVALTPDKGHGHDRRIPLKEGQQRVGERNEGVSGSRHCGAEIGIGHVN